MRSQHNRSGPHKQVDKELSEDEIIDVSGGAINLADDRSRLQTARLQRLSDRVSLHRKASMSKPTFGIIGSDFAQALSNSLDKVGNRLAAAAT